MKTGKVGYARLGRRVVIPHAELEKLLRRATVKSTAPLDADEPMRPTAKHGKAPEACTPEASNGGTVRPVLFDKEQVNGTTPTTQGTA
jgi:hypothetical protein